MGIHWGYIDPFPKEGKKMVKSKKTVNYDLAWMSLAISRIMIGFVFLWAFLDKTFGLGFATEAGKAWVNGASPTAGFLKFGVNKEGPFVDFFHSLAGSVVVDWLFMLGLLGIGLALVLGVGLRVAAVSATVLLVMMWAAELPLENNPLIDDHLIYAAVIWVAALGARQMSLFNWWSQFPVVKKNKWLW